MNLLKILIAPAHLVIDPSLGSESAIVYYIITKIAERYPVEINAIVGKAHSNLPVKIRIYENGVSHWDLQGKILFHARTYKIARRLLREVDIVHAMLPFGLRSGFNLLAVFGNLRNKPFVIGPIQYPQPAEITDYEYVSGRRGLQARLLYGVEHFLKNMGRISIDTLHKITLSEAEALVFDSKKTLDLFEKFYPDYVKNKIIDTIPVGVDLEFYKYTPPIKKQHVEILTVANIVKRKGIQYLIRSMPLIIKETNNVKFRVVGKGPYLEELVKLTRKLGLNKYVEFTGRVPWEELPRIYANCDIYVHPSIAEGFPTVIREAMSVGRPVIAFDVGVISDHVINGVNGYVVRAGDIRGLIEKIIELLLDEEKRLKMSIEARKHAEENFDWNRIADRYYNVYCRVIGK